MEDLSAQEHLIQLGCDAEATKAEMNKVQCQLKRQRSHGAADNRKIGMFSKHVVLVLFALAGNASVAVEYLHRYKKRYHHVNVPKDELAPVVEQWVIDLPQWAYDTLLLSSPWHVYNKASQEARKFFAEHSAVTWIEINNESKAVAPSTISVMEKYDEELVGQERILNDIHYDMRQDIRVSRHRVFAWRFRQRWKIGLHGLKERGLVAIPKRQAKVFIFS